MNDLWLWQNGFERVRFDDQISGCLEWCFDGWRDGFVGDIDESVRREDFHGGGVEIERRIKWLAWNPIIDAVVDGQFHICGIDCK